MKIEKVDFWLALDDYPLFRYSDYDTCKSALEHLKLHHAESVDVSALSIKKIVVLSEIN